MKKKPWYIWLSFPAFMFLAGDSQHRISKYAKKNKNFSRLDNQASLTGNILGLVFLRLLLPASVLLYVYHLNETRWEVLGTTSAEVIQFICIYVLGVHIAYKHVQWREKHIAHLLKSKQETEE